MDVVPPIFSHALFRFGHSMVRKRYVLNGRTVRAGRSLRVVADLENLFLHRKNDPALKYRIQYENIIKWAKFFSYRSGEEVAQKASKIDFKIVNPMASAPPVSAPVNVVERNILAGEYKKLPTAGQILDYLKTYHNDFVTRATCHFSHEFSYQIPTS